MKVSVYSRKSIKKLITDRDFPENTAVISFCDTESGRIEKEYSQVDYRGVCNDVFYCEIDDLDRDELAEKGYTYDTFFPEADKLAEFIYCACNSGMDIICQCEYGQGRSAGCAAAILEHFYNNGISVFVNYNYYPSKVVYHKVFDALDKLRSDRMI